MKKLIINPSDYTPCPNFNRETNRCELGSENNCLGELVDPNTKAICSRSLMEMKTETHVEYIPDNLGGKVKTSRPDKFLEEDLT
jgi:hypothetical protein